MARHRVPSQSIESTMKPNMCERRGGGCECFLWVACEQVQAFVCVAVRAGCAALDQQTQVDALSSRLLFYILFFQEIAPSPGRGSRARAKERHRFVALYCANSLSQMHLLTNKHRRGSQTINLQT